MDAGATKRSQRRNQRLAEYRARLADKLEYHRNSQFLFDEQWHALKNMPMTNFIQIIGDMPIYVVADSVEMWANLTLLKQMKKVIHFVAKSCGWFFSARSQGGTKFIIGKQWKKMDTLGEQTTTSKFWILMSFLVDHFRGFSAYWEIPAEAKTQQSEMSYVLYDCIKAVVKSNSENCQLSQ